MSRASQSECQLGDGLLRKKLVDAKTDLVASESGQLGEQGRRIDLEHELATATTDHLAMWPLCWRQDLVQRFVVAAALLASPYLTEDVAKKVTGWLRIAQRVCASRTRPSRPVGLTTDRTTTDRGTTDRVTSGPFCWPIHRPAFGFSRHSQAPLIGITT